MSLVTTLLKATILIYSEEVQISMESELPRIISYLNVSIKMKRREREVINNFTEIPWMLDQGDTVY
jgi:hypothetical protein